MKPLSERLRRLSLLTGCLFSAPFLRKANKRPLNLSAVIVVLTGKLGDIVCGTPVLRAIREHLPGTRIIVGGTPNLQRPLLSDSGLVDEYLDLEEKGAAARIKSCGAEAGLVAGPSYEPTALLYLAGVPLVVAPKVLDGYSPSETRPYKIIRRLVSTFPYRMGEYAPRERLRVLEPLGITFSDTTKHLGFSESAAEKAKKFFTDNGIDIKKDFIVGISPSAGHKIKEWPAGRFASVADYLHEKYNAKIIIIGGKGDMDKADEMLAHMNEKTPVVDSSGEFDIDGLKALMSQLRMFISVDTGPIYIAEAFNVSTIDITGPIDENEQPPRGPFHRNVVPPNRKGPELFVLNARSYNKKEALRQIESITVPLVLNEIDLLLKNLSLKNENTR